MLEEFQDERTTRSHERRGRRRGRRLLVSLLALVLLAVAGVGGYLLFLNQTVSGNITREPLLPPPSEAGNGDGGSQPGSKGTARKAPVDGPGENILLIGSDARPGESRGRSDVMVLMHISQDRSTVHLIHFPRDLYVTIPGRGKDKLNAAYAYGGAPLLVTSLQDLVGAKVDHVAMIGFEGFKNMTNAVGGVRVLAEEPSVNDDGFRIVKGWNDLNGEQALGFVRERYELSEGDISRGRRQQAFIKALMLKTLTRETLTNPLTVARLADAASENLTVDETFTMGQIRSLGLSLRDIRGDDITFVTAPFTGFGTSPSGASIDIVDEVQMEILGEGLRTDTLSDYRDPGQ